MLFLNQMWAPPYWAPLLEALNRGALTFESPDLNILHIFRIRIYDLNTVMHDWTPEFCSYKFRVFKFRFICVYKKVIWRYALWWWWCVVRKVFLFAGARGEHAGPLRRHPRFRIHRSLKQALKKTEKPKQVAVFPATRRTYSRWIAWYLVVSHVFLLIWIGNSISFHFLS